MSNKKSLLQQNMWLQPQQPASTGRQTRDEYLNSVLEEFCSTRSTYTMGELDSYLLEKGFSQRELSAYHRSIGLR